MFVISGNHDSPERIAFGGRLMNSSGVYMSPVYVGKTEPVSLSDKYGPVNIYMLPFFKPAANSQFLSRFGNYYIYRCCSGGCRADGN